MLHEITINQFHDKTEKTMADHHDQTARELIAARKPGDPFAIMDSVVNQINETIKVRNIQQSLIKEKFNSF